MLRLSCDAVKHMSTFFFFFLVFPEARRGYQSVLVSCIILSQFEYYLRLLDWLCHSASAAQPQVTNHASMIHLQIMKKVFGMTNGNANAIEMELQGDRSGNG